jgi:drug/metabolite transporter (DMT)-like permease
MSQPESIFARTFNPIYQAGMALGGVVLFSLVAKLAHSTGLVDVPQRFPWMAAASFMLLFALFNSIFSLSSENLMKYWGKSLYCFMGLAAGAGFFAYLLSSLTMNEAGSYRWIYIVVAIGYLVFLSMMAMLRRIVEFAQREEWHQPRQRRK